MNIKPNNTQLIAAQNRFRLMLDMAADKFCNPKDLSRLERKIERSRGEWNAEILNDSNSVNDAVNMVKQEIAMGNFDFIRGLNKVLNKDMAEKLYSSL